MSSSSSNAAALRKSWNPHNSRRARESEDHNAAPSTKRKRTTPGIFGNSISVEDTVAADMELISHAHAHIFAQLARNIQDPVSSPSGELANTNQLSSICYQELLTPEVYPNQACSPATALGGEIRAPHANLVATTLVSQNKGEIPFAQAMANAFLSIQSTIHQQNKSMRYTMAQQRSFSSQHAQQLEVMLNLARDAASAAMNAEQNVEHMHNAPPPKKTSHQMRAARFQ